MVEVSSSPRLEKLESLHAKDPANSFIRYGLAMELKSLGRIEESISTFQALLAHDPDYVMAYQHGGYVLRDAGRRGEARQLFETGVEVARRVGNKRAADEMTEAIEDLDL